MPLDFESDLNPEQLKAVQAVSGPCLVLAGAGSGKTRVITYKVAHLISDCGLPPSRIMAVTFTNKAAGEMKSRVDVLLGTEASGRDWWIGTFHSLCVRILRDQIRRLNRGYSSHFSIIDEREQLRLLRQCASQLGITPMKPDLRDWSSSSKSKEKGSVDWFKDVAARISDDKANLISPEDLVGPFYHSYDKDVADMYGAYQRLLERYNALDFDDLIALVIMLFRENPDVEHYYGDKFEQVLVDEYQDVNRMQHDLVRRLSQVHGNITAVGDDDQSIYAFRGADSKQILRFEKDYPGTNVIKLERNYRSTGAILEACNALVSHNSRRYPKNLWTSGESGKPVVVFQAMTPEEEAERVANALLAVATHGPGRGQSAVVYRSNSQSRAVEEVFMRRGIPYRIVKGLRFYERKAVKDILAYLRLASNHSDNFAFERAISNPPRGCGSKTKMMETLKILAEEHRLSWFDSLLLWLQQSKPSKLADKLHVFADIIQTIGAKQDSVTDAVYALRESSGLFASQAGREEDSESDARRKSKESGDETGGNRDEESRLENLEEFVHAVEEYERRNADGSIMAFLSRASLLQDQDSLTGGQGGEVVLVTAHSVKGLEFDYVFVIGVEEGLFPHYRSQLTTEIDEERRLLYVACTRARKQLWISYCARRPAFGRGPDASTTPDPSRFIGEMGEHVQEAQRMPQYGWAADGVRVGDEPKNNLSVALLEGDSVMHEVFGQGRVLAVAYEGDVEILVIDFKKAGIKKLAAQYAPLTKVSP